jgi:amidase
MTELHFQSASELAGGIKAKEIGCLELLEHFLDRCERHNPALNAIVTWDREGARTRAKQADEALAKGEDWGPLHGLPMTVKESFDAVGMPTTWGLPGLANNVPTTNAVLVDRLLGAGAVLFGKTNVPLMLADWQSFNEVYGTTNNPWDVRRAPGGSSGGSAAALAAGLTGLDAGSDIGASIRNPAHYCGVYGHKPTYGIVPVRGLATPGVLAPGDISVVGPMARSAEDLALELGIVAGPDEMDAPGWRLALPKPRRKSLKGYRIAVMLSDPVCPVDSAYSDRIQAVAEAAAKAGAEVDFKARPKIDMQRSHDIYIQLLRGVTSARLPVEEFENNLAKAAALDDDDTTYPDQQVRAAVQYHRDWVGANEERMHMRWAWHEFFREWDVLLCPTASTDAMAHDQEGERWERFINVNGEPQSQVDQLFWAGMSGVVYLPSTIAPAGLTPAGLPTGVQIVGPHLGDLQTIDFARLLADEIGGFQAPPGYD